MLLSVKNFFFFNSYIGCDKRFCNKFMSAFIVGSKFNFFLINLNYTVFLFIKALLFLRVFIQKKKNIILYVPVDLDNKVSVKSKKKKTVTFTSKRLLLLVNWTFGFLTNAASLWEQLKYKYVYKNGFPSIIILLQNYNYCSIVNECILLNVPTIGFMDTSQNPLACDYVVPINLSSSEFVYFYKKLITSFMQVYIYKIRLKFFKSLFSLFFERNKNLSLKFNTKIKVNPKNFQEKNFKDIINKLMPLLSQRKKESNPGLFKGVPKCKVRVRNIR